MGFFLVMKAELVRTWIVMRRYWFRTITGMIMGYGMLMVLVGGVVLNGPDALKNISQLHDPVKASNFILGFIIGMYAFGVVGMFSQGLQNMATTGVLEQLCMSPHGLITNFMVQTLVTSVSSVLSSSVMVFFVTKTVEIYYKTGNTLHWDTLPVVVLLGLTFFNLIGFGFMVGGLVLVFKQVGQLAIILRMALFGLAVFAREEILNNPWPFRIFMHLLPVTDAAISLKYVLIKGQMNNDTFVPIFQHSSFYWLVANSILWTGIGLVVFRVMEDWSRSKGTLGSY